jgi:hypothetical protein
MIRLGSKYSAAVIILLLAAILAACSSNNNGKSNRSGETSDAGSGKTPQKVTVLAVGEMIEDSVDAVTGQKIIGLNTRFEAFRSNPEYAHITVEFVETPWADMQNKVNALNADGSLDVMAGMGPYMPASGSTQNITDLFNLDYDEIMSMYPEDTRPYVEQWIKGGDEVVGLVQRIWPYVIAYDKKIFDDFGVPYLPETYTVEQLVETARKLTGKNPRTGKQTYGIGVAANDGWKLNLVFQDFMAYYNPNPDQPYAADWGGSYFDYTVNPAKYFKDGKVTVDISSGDRIKAFEQGFALIASMPPGALNGEGMNNWFTEDNDVAIWYYPEYGPYGAYVEDIMNGDTSFFDRYGVVGSYKRPDTGRGGMPNLTYVYMLSNAKVDDPERREAVWAVMKYLASFDYNKYYYLANLEPSIQIGYEDIRFSADLGFDAIMKHIQTLEKLDPSFTSPHDWALDIFMAQAAAEQSVKGPTPISEIHRLVAEQEETYKEAVREYWAKLNQ